MPKASFFAGLENNRLPSQTERLQKILSWKHGDIEFDPNSTESMIRPVLLRSFGDACVEILRYFKTRSRMINFDSSVFVATLTQLYEMSRNYAKYAGARRQLARSYNRDDFLELIRNEQTKTDPKDRQILLWSDIETMYQLWESGIVEQLENEKEAYYMKEYGADYKKLIDALESGAFEEKPPTYDDIARARSELIRNDPRTKAAKEQARFDKEEKRKKAARQTFKKHGEQVPSYLKSN